MKGIPPIPRVPRAPQARNMAPKANVPKPGNTPIVNHMAFTDDRPTLGGKSTTYNPDGSIQAGVLPKGPPKYVGGTRRIAEGVSNRRYQYD